MPAVSVPVETLTFWMGNGVRYLESLRRSTQTVTFPGAVWIQ